MDEQRFSEPIRCGHCGNNTIMKIVGEYSRVKDYDDPQSGFFWEAGRVYHILLCPACGNVTFRKCYWHSLRLDQGDPVEFEVLYPTQYLGPAGLPDRIQRAYDVANKVRNVDVNAYVVLLGRLIELICGDRNAKGATLAEKIKDLSDKGEIPAKLVSIADSLRQLRNIGAHAFLGDLTPKEIPILDNLCKAILEYVYTAPLIVSQAEKRLKALKGEESVIESQNQTK